MSHMLRIKKSEDISEGSVCSLTVLLKYRKLSLKKESKILTFLEGRKPHFK